MYLSRKEGTSLQWMQFSLYKLWFHFKSVLGESIILLLPPPTYKAYPIAILVHDHCAIYAPPPIPPSYTMHHTKLVMAISCKGQDAVDKRVAHVALVLMYMYVCMYVCMYIYISIYISISIPMYLSIYLSMCLYIYIPGRRRRARRCSG